MKSPEQIAAKIVEIYEQAAKSFTPITTLCIETSILLGKGDWMPAEVEQVSSEVLTLLIKHGWKKSAAPQILDS
jgi:hypothetical protein